MAGHPPKISTTKNNTDVVFSFRECPSVPAKSVKRAFSALKRAKLLPESATIANADGYVYVTAEIPAHVPHDGRSTAHKKWRDSLQNIIHVVNICIQSERAPREVVRHIGTVVGIAA